MGLNWPHPRGLGKHYNKSGKSKSVKKSLKVQIFRSIKVILVIEEVLNPKGDPIASTANNTMPEKKKKKKRDSTSGGTWVCSVSKLSIL